LHENGIKKIMKK